MTIDYLAILLGATGGMAVGAAWFAPALLGRRWAALVGVDLALKTPPGVYLLAGIATLVTSAVLAVGTDAAVQAFGGSRPGVALTVALVLWLGFTAGRTAVEYLFEKRPVALYAIDMGHQLAVVVVMAVIIGLLGH